MRFTIGLLLLPLALSVAACGAPSQSSSAGTDAGTGPVAPTPTVAPTLTPNLVATQEAVSTAVMEEEAATAQDAVAAAEANAGAGVADLPAEITSRLWRLEQYRNAQGEMAAVLEKAPITAEWADYTLSGETGCYAYSGPYVRQEDGAITVQQVQLTPLGMGNQGCERNGPESNQQADYLDALYKSAVYTVREAGALELSSADGDLLLVFQTSE